MNLVRGWDRDSSGDWDLVWLGDLLLNNDLTGNSSGDSDRDINIVFVDLDLWDNVGDLGSDPGVRSDWSSDSGLDHSVSGSGASWDRCWWNSSVRSWSSWDSGGWESSGLNEVLGSSGGVGNSGLGNVLDSGNNNVVTSNN